jgi:hypothetical protein
MLTWQFVEYDENTCQKLCLQKISKLTIINDLVYFLPTIPGRGSHPLIYVMIFY